MIEPETETCGAQSGEEAGAFWHRRVDENMDLHGERKQMVPMPEDEVARLEALYGLGLLDTAPEAEFDEIARLAASICGTPVSLITLIDEHRQWFKAHHGLDLRETPRSISFCAFTIAQDQLFIVSDATLDPRFAKSPLVVKKPHIRFYAGVPLILPGGHAVGTLSVIDTVPRTLTDNQIEALGVLGRQIRTILEVKMHRRQLQEALAKNQEMAQGLRASEATFRTFMNNSPTISFMKDEQGCYVFYNLCFAECFNIDMEQWLGKSDLEIWPAEQAALFRENDLQVLSGGKAIEYLEETPLPDGGKRQWKSYKFPCGDAHGKQLLAGIAIDVTQEVQRETILKKNQHELEEANDRLRKMAMTDVLTGLANRRMFEERLTVEFAMARRRKRDLSLLIMDVDNFKKLNDQYGHAVGDDVLRQLGIILRRTLRVTDLTARYGGEEFTVLLPETDAVNATLLAERIADQVGRHDFGMVAPTLSIGVATLDHRCIAPSELVVVADAALYKAKYGGKNQIVVAGK